MDTDIRWKASNIPADDEKLIFPLIVLEVTKLLCNKQQERIHIVFKLCSEQQIKY